MAADPLMAGNPTSSIKLWTAEAQVASFELGSSRLQRRLLAASALLRFWRRVSEQLLSPCHVQKPRCPWWQVPPPRLADRPHQGKKRPATKHQPPRRPAAPAIPPTAWKQRQCQKSRRASWAVALEEEDDAAAPMEEDADSSTVYELKPARIAHKCY